MSQDFLLGQLRLIVVGIIMYCSGRGLLSPADSGFIISMLAPIGLIAGPWIWSIYSNLNMKLVPHDSVAIEPHAITGGAVVGATVGLPSTAKVVGALLIGFLLFAPHDARAQVKRPPINLDPLHLITPAAPSTSPLANLDTTLNKVGGKIQAIEKDLADKVITDLQAAITDATNHKDNISLPCWQANLALAQALPAEWPTPPTLPIGIALSIQIQRDLINAITSNDSGSLKVACAALWGDQLSQISQLGLMFGFAL